MKKPLILILVLLYQPALADEQALAKCRQIENSAERASCYDEFVDSRFPTGQSANIETDAPPGPTESNAVPDAQSLFGTNEADARRIVETSLAIEQIEAMATDVRESATRKLTVTLDNGQIWRQLDNRPMPLKRGETVIIRKASLSSFLMEKKSGSRSIRVKRAN